MGGNVVSPAVNGFYVLYVTYHIENVSNLLNLSNYLI